MAKPARTSPAPSACFIRAGGGRRPRRRCAAAGTTVSATTTEPTRQNVLVKARGRNSLPSGPDIAKTGRKPTTVVEMAVRMALPTSLAAR